MENNLREINKKIASTYESSADNETKERIINELFSKKRKILNELEYGELEEVKRSTPQV